MTTTTKLIELVQGDTNDTRVVTLDGIDTLPAANDVEAHVVKTTAPTSATTLTAEVVDAAERTVRIYFGTWIDTAEVSAAWLWRVQVTGTWSDGETGPRTFPTSRGNPLTVWADSG